MDAYMNSSRIWQRSFSSFRQSVNTRSSTDGEDKKGDETSDTAVQTEDFPECAKSPLENTIQRNFYDALLDPEVAKWIVQSEN